MKKMRLLIVGLVVFTSACAILGSKSSVDVFYRSDLATKTGKVIVFPVLSFDGKKTEGARSVEMALLGKCAGLYGKSNIIPVGPVIEQLAGSGGFVELVKSLDNASAVEQVHQNPRIREALGTITSLLGNSNLALAIIDGGQQEFDSGREIHLHIGFFDIQNLTWKWITKASTQKGKVGKWELSASEMVSKSFKELEAKGDK